jgi:hypothetical protein
MLDHATRSKPTGPPPWPYGWIAFGAVAAAVIIWLLV